MGDRATIHPLKASSMVFELSIVIPIYKVRKLLGVCWRRYRRCRQYGRPTSALDIKSTRLFS